jgi:hypothetical protein
MKNILNINKIQLMLLVLRRASIEQAYFHPTGMQLAILDIA